MSSHLLLEGNKLCLRQVQGSNPDIAFSYLFGVHRDYDVDRVFDSLRRTLESVQLALESTPAEKSERAYHCDENILLPELIRGLIHEFPLCCVLHYAADAARADSVSGQKMATQRGVVFFRTFSIHPAEELDNGSVFGQVHEPDHFVPCEKCKKRRLEFAGQSSVITQIAIVTR